MHQPREPLPFDETPPPATGSEPERKAGVDDLLVAHTPLLARAFAAAGAVPEPLLGKP